MSAINRVIYANGDFHHSAVQGLFERIPLHEVPRLAAGGMIWVESDLDSHVYSFERARINRVIDTDQELAVACIGIETGTSYRRQVMSMHPVDFFRLKDEPALVRLVANEPRLVNARLISAD